MEADANSSSDIECDSSKKSLLAVDNIEIQFDAHDQECDTNASTKAETNISCEEAAIDEIFCGYLNKLSHKSLIKTWKRRWFVHFNKSCQLKYYHSENDDVPLGIINISKATFTFDAMNKEHPGMFQIKTVYREYFLEASSRDLCCKWLRHLQSSRRIFSLKRTNNITNGILIPETSHPDSGLLSPSKDEKIRDTVVQVAEPFRHKGNLSQSKDKLSYTNIRKQMVNAFKSMSPTNEVKQARSRPESVALSEMSSCADDDDNESQISFFDETCHASEGSSPGIRNKKSPLMRSFRRKLRISKDVDNAMGQSFTSNQQKIKQSGCSSCYKLGEEVDQLKLDKSSIEEELQAEKEVVSVLRKHLSLAAAERNNYNELLGARCTKEMQKLLMDKDETIIELEDSNNKNKLQVEKLKEEINERNIQLDAVQEQCAMLKELLQAKDKAVVSLTNEIFDLEAERQCDDTGNNNNNNIFGSNRTSIMSSTPSCIDCIDLRDSLDAYQEQNKFLNSEIIQLNALITEADQREAKLLTLCSEWEARFCQIHSKYLLLLKELHSPRSDIEESKNLVSQLVQDALDQDAKHILRRTSLACLSSGASRYDEFGFDRTWGMEDDILGQKVESLKQRSDVISDSLSNVETDQWMSKWDNYNTSSVGNKELVRSPELKALIRSGIPHKYRGKIWRSCIDWRVKNIKSRSKSNYYHMLLASHTKVSILNANVKQIELDLLRTLPNNRHYETLHSDGIPRLRRVLLAYSWHNPSVGYCQGINRLAAIALLFLEEEDAFWCLVAIIEKILPVDYYSKTMITSQVDQRVLKDLFQEKLPRLHSHLEANDVDLSLVTFTWLITIFVDNIPVKTYLQIWDSFLYEGSKVLFRYALAIFKYSEEDILQQEDYMAINLYLRSIPQTVTNVKSLSQIAFNGLNPFPMRSISSKRTHHMQIVRRELEEIEAIRSSVFSNDKDDTFSDED